MGTYSDTDKTALRVGYTDQEIRQQRDDNARRNVHAFASWEDDPAEWAADILAYLGLDVETSSRPSPVRLIKPDEVKGPGKRPKDADTYESPTSPTERTPRKDQPACGTPGGYYRHQRYKQPACEPCLEAHKAEGRSMRARRREKAKAERARYLRELQIEALGPGGGQP